MPKYAVLKVRKMASQKYGKKTHLIKFLGSVHKLREGGAWQFSLRNGLYNFDPPSEKGIKILTPPFPIFNTLSFTPFRYYMKHVIQSITI